jgi:hypothetical protein
MREQEAATYSQIYKVARLPLSTTFAIKSNKNAAGKAW